MVRWVLKKFYGTGYEFRHFSDSDLKSLQSCIELIDWHYKMGDITDEADEIIAGLVDLMRKVHQR